MHVDADLHIHSHYSRAVSQKTHPATLIEASRMKGISALGSGDALHPDWRAEWRDHLVNDAGILIVPSDELEDNHRIHHLVLMRDFEGFSELYDLLAEYSGDIGTEGRPHVALTGEEIAQRVHRLGGWIGPSHAFSPWTSLFAAYDHVRQSYGNERIDLLELGLSADSSYGAGIPDLYGVPFISNSDAHSPSPLRIGREFNRLDIRQKSIGSVLEGVFQGRIEMNVGLFPEEGKYNRTACTRGFEQYLPSEAEALGWHCPHDHGLIKKGVRDRARELSIGEVRKRPPYLHMIPLGEIVQRVLGVASPYSKRCQILYKTLIAELGTEIEILLERTIAEIGEVDSRVADAIDALRSNRVKLFPGGGGKYGTFSFLTADAV
jgi:uncharacterized protein (TIGR00375 family)